MPVALCLATSITDVSKLLSFFLFPGAKVQKFHHGCSYLMRDCANVRLVCWMRSAMFIPAKTEHSSRSFGGIWRLRLRWRCWAKRRLNRGSNSKSKKAGAIAPVSALDNGNNAIASEPAESTSKFSVSDEVKATVAAVATTLIMVNNEVFMVDVNEYTVWCLFLQITFSSNRRADTQTPTAPGHCSCSTNQNRRVSLIHFRPRGKIPRRHSSSFSIQRSTRQNECR